MVQARWDHLNEDANWLTRAQSLLLDGHFFFEHGGRYRGGLFFNFNGTAGMWRRACLDDAGGWQADTLTEDLASRSGRSPCGWRYVFLEDVGVRGELPTRRAPSRSSSGGGPRGGFRRHANSCPNYCAGPGGSP